MTLVSSTQHTSSWSCSVLLTLAMAGCGDSSESRQQDEAPSESQAVLDEVLRVYPSNIEMEPEVVHAIGAPWNVSEVQYIDQLLGALAPIVAAEDEALKWLLVDWQEKVFPKKHVILIGDNKSGFLIDGSISPDGKITISRMLFAEGGQSAAILSTIIEEAFHYHQDEAPLLTYQAVVDTEVEAKQYVIDVLSRLRGYSESDDWRQELNVTIEAQRAKIAAYTSGVNEKFYK